MSGHDRIVLGPSKEVLGPGKEVLGPGKVVLGPGKELLKCFLISTLVNVSILENSYGINCRHRFLAHSKCVPMKWTTQMWSSFAINYLCVTCCNSFVLKVLGWCNLYYH